MATTTPYADPGASGPYPVGLTTLTLPEVAGYDDVLVDVWYPARDVSGPKTAYDFLGVSFDADAWRDAEPDARAPRRLVGFSHGLGGVRDQNYAMAERLASFGFVVVAPDHTGTTTLDFLSAYGNLGPPLVRRPAVLRSAIDAVVDGAVPGLVPSSDRYGLVGHSLGAWTVMTVAGGRPSAEGYAAACASDDPPGACDLIGELAYDPDEVTRYDQPDDRVVTVILQSPGGVYGFEPGTLGGIGHALVMAGTLDTVLPYEAENVPVYEALGAPASLLTVPGAGHYGWTNMCDLAVATAFAPDCEGAAGGFVDPLWVRATSDRYVTAWMGAELGGEEAFRADLVATEGVTWAERSP